VIFHQSFPNKLIKFKHFNFDKTDFLAVGDIVLDKLSFQKVLTNNFWPKSGKGGKKTI